MVSSSPSCGESYKSVFARGSSVHQKCSNFALTNLLFGLCKSVWIIKQLIIHLSPSWSSSTPLYPKSITNQKSHPNSFSFCYLDLWTHNWVHQGAWRCVTKTMDLKGLNCSWSFLKNQQFINIVVHFWTKILDWLSHSHHINSIGSWIKKKKILNITTTTITNIKTPYPSNL